MSKGQWRKWSLGLGILFAAVCCCGRRPPGHRRTSISSRPSWRRRSRQQAELTDRINQLEARQKLKEKALDEKIEQATAPKPRRRRRRTSSPSPSSGPRS